MRSQKVWIPLILFLAVAGWQAASNPARGQAGGSSAPGGVAVVDVVRIFEDCDQIKDLNSLLREQKDQLDKEAETRRKAMAAKEAELSAFNPSSPDYALRRREYTRLAIENNVWLETTRADLRRDHFNWTRTIYDECTAAVGDVAKERGASVVLQKREFKPELIADENVDNLKQMIQTRHVVHADAGLDLTDAVIKKMNQRYKERGGRAKLSGGNPAGGS